jgi:DNA invertase Pin-like site-specific DNA recombinase
MIAAIYARKSTEQNGLADESKSIARQVEHARAYAARKGWAVADAHVYADDGISGAVFGDARPGLARLLNGLKPRPAFQVLVMSEESRLGREQIETAYLLKQLVTAGVRVFFYLEDTERTLDSPTDKLLLSVSGFASEVERQKASQRTADAFLRMARAGHATGGRTFGYDHRVVMVAGQRSHTERVVNEAEAPIVVRIFELAAEGKGFKRIADHLNHAGAIAPLPRRAGRDRSWSTSSVRECLYRETYRGVVIYNRVQKRNQWGIKTYTPRPESEWLTVPAPAPRIVSEDLWAAAHARLAQSRDTYVLRTGGKLWGDPRTASSRSTC